MLTPEGTGGNRLASATMTRLLADHPDHAGALRGCMWMGAEDGVHHFKHSITRSCFTYDPRSGRIVGELDTGEESDNADMILRNLDRL
jgi:hypothetical protein